MGDLERQRENAREIFSGIAMAGTLGLELLDVDEKTATMGLTVDHRHLNYLGGLHGGAVSALLDTVAFFPAVLLPSGRRFTTEGLSVHYFRPAAAGDRLIAKARVLRLGKRVANVEVQVAGAEGKVVAHGLVTLLVL